MAVEKEIEVDENTIKNGGFLINGEYTSNQTVEFKEENEEAYVSVYPFAGPHRATTMQQPLSTAYYNFHEKTGE